MAKHLFHSVLLLAGFYPELKGFSERNIGRMIRFSGEYPDLFAILPPEQQSLFMQLVKQGLAERKTITTREERQLKRALQRQLEEKEIPQADIITPILIGIGIYENVDSFEFRKDSLNGIFKFLQELLQFLLFIAAIFELPVEYFCYKK